MIQIHSMKSQLLNIGYSLLADKARALEVAGKEGCYDDIEKQLPDYIKSYKGFLKQLEAIK